MEVTALCMQIFMNMFVLLLTKPDLSYTDQKPAVPLISPDRLQFFEYESVSVSCEEDKAVKAWRVRRKLPQTSSANDSDACSVPAASCSIQFAFESHSGEYWCENHEGEKSRALNISVTAGPVILHVSSQPVKEGSTVTLKCIQRDTEDPHFSDFYKDGVRLGTDYETDMTFTKVTKSDKGLYKCTISQVGESPESWLAVVNPRSPTEGSNEEIHNEEIQPLTNVPIIIITLLSIVFTLVFWVIGLILYKKHKALRNEIVSDPKETTYAVVNKPGKKKGDSANKPDEVPYAAVEIKKKGDSANKPDEVTYAAVEIKKKGDSANKPDEVTYAAVEIKKKGSKASRATAAQGPSEQQSVYSSIALKRGQLS